MFDYILNPKYRRITRRHNIPYGQRDASSCQPITSIVIPSVGEDYVAEALLCATFAARFATTVQEIVVVTDQPEQKFSALPPKTRLVTLQIERRVDDYLYKQIYLSRLIKIQAPLQARTEGILMIDSDLNLLQMPDIGLAEDEIYSSFRRGKMIAKLNAMAVDHIPAYYRDTIRPRLKDHVNGAFLAATRRTWQRMCPIWIALFKDTWERVAANQPPTDQLPLAAMLDILDIRTVNLGEWMNWPVSKKIGGTPAIVPPQVVGAHGGFPLTEWQKYLQSPDKPLLFKPEEYTRRVRYLADSEKT